MLNFPLWKVSLILGILLWGAVLAIPNAMTDGFLGIVPREPSDRTDLAAVAAYEQQLQEAEDSWWFLPNGKLNLGLDLQGGVYLLMEIDPAEIAANRLNTVQSDIRTALNRSPLVERQPPVQNEDRLTIELINPDEDMAEALRRLERINPTIGTTQTNLYSVNQTGDRFIQLTVPGNARTALASDAQAKMMEIIRRRIDPDGVAEISITPQCDNRIILEAPGEADPKRIKDILGQAGRLTFNMANLDPSAIRAAVTSGRPPPREELVDSEDYGQILINRIPELTGADIATANRCFDEANFPAVCFRLNSSAATKFYNLTRNNTGRNFAIVLDGTSMS